MFTTKRCLNVEFNRWHWAADTTRENSKSSVQLSLKNFHSREAF